RSWCTPQFTTEPIVCRFRKIPSCATPHARLRSQRASQYVTLTPTMEAYSADWLMPIRKPPILDGAIVIDADRIVFIGSGLEARTRPEYRDAKWTDFGRAAILPGFVNTHAHLELTVMRGFLEGLPFQEWIAKVTKTRRDQLTPEALQASALLGVTEAILAG